MRKSSTLLFSQNFIRIAWSRLHYTSITNFSRPYFSNGRAIGMVVVRLSVCPSVCTGCIVAKF